MDFPGFHVDGSAITAFLVLANTLITLWVARKTVATHDAVNGMQAAKVSEAHLSGVAEGASAVPPVTRP